MKAVSHTGEQVGVKSRWQTSSICLSDAIVFLNLSSRASERPVRRHKSLQHGSNKCVRINYVACLSFENCRVSGQVAVNGSRQFDGYRDRLIILGLPLSSVCSFDHPRYGSSTRSRLTITRTGNPGRIVSVG